MDAPNMVEAVFNNNTGETLLAHPTKPDVFVTPTHFQEIIQGGHDDSNCVYTSETICAEWQASRNPSILGHICVRYRTIQTCSCK